MRLVRRYALLVSVALLVPSLSASGAHADALRVGGVAVPVGFALGATSTGISFNTVFPQSVTCPGSTIGSTVTTNNVAFMPATATLNTLSFAACVVAVPLTSCTVTTNALPWGGGVRLDVGPPKAFTIVVPTVASWTITCGFGPPLGITTCTYKANTGVPPIDLPATWVDAPPPSPNPASIRFNNAPLRRIAPSAAACAMNPTFSGLYRTTTNDLTLTP
jgi:hypothetical protein